MKTETTQQMLERNVNSIVNDLEDGIQVTEEDAEYNTYDCDYEEGDIISGYDYLTDVLDINYIVSSSKEYLGAELLVAFGGPNIYINTKSQTVSGYWGNDRVTIGYYRDTMDIDSALQELYEYQ